MKQVKLIKDVVQGGHIKALKRPNPAYKPGGAAPEFLHTFFVQGTVVPLSDASAAKYVEQGLGEIVA